MSACEMMPTLSILQVEQNENVLQAIKQGTQSQAGGEARHLTATVNGFRNSHRSSEIQVRLFRHVPRLRREIWGDPCIHIDCFLHAHSGWLRFADFYKLRLPLEDRSVAFLYLSIARLCRVVEHDPTSHAESNDQSGWSVSYRSTRDEFASMLCSVQPTEQHKASHYPEARSKAFDKGVSLVHTIY